MMSTGKVVERKRDFRNVKESEELRQATQTKASSITEIDLSFN